MEANSVMDPVVMRSSNRFASTVLMAALGLILAGRGTAQTFTTLHSFSALYSTIYGATNSDGATPTGCGWQKFGRELK